MSICLAFAEDIARDMVDKLWPHCEHIEIAGSIRRRRPQVNDIDLVVIPRWTSKRVLFTPTEIDQTEFYDAVLGCVIRLETEGPKILRGAISSFPGSPKLDIYIATRETWATLLLIRTGSAEHNIWLAQRAKDCGLKLHADGSGLELPTKYDELSQRSLGSDLVHPDSEEEIFKALGLPTPPPTLRECMNGRPVWLQGATA